MTWIKTIPLADADERLRTLLRAQRALYPAEYGPTSPAESKDTNELPGIVASHTLLPDVLYHAFSTFGALMDPELPLSRRHHEMIATTVSVLNRCKY